MGAVWFAARADARHRWRSILVMGLVIGLAGGVVLASFAGARRTRSAFDRLRTETRAGDLSISIPQVSPRFAARIGNLPGVESWAQVRPLAAVIVSGYMPFAVPVDGRFGRDVDRARLIAGRPARGIREIVLSQSSARILHLGVGDGLKVRTFTPEQTAVFRDPSTNVNPKPGGPPLRFRVVGIDQRPLDLTPTGERTGIIVAPRSVYQAYRGRIGNFGGIMRVRLEPGASRRDFARRVRAIAGDRFVGFDTTTADEGVNESLGVLAGGLVVFGAIGALGMLAAISVLSARANAASLADQPVWRGLGMTGPQRVLATAFPGAPGIAGGAMLAVIVAAVASWFMPTGLGRRVEPTPGFAVDGLVLGIGGVVLFAVSIGITLVGAWRVSRRSSWDPSRQRVAVHASRLARAVARTGASVPAIVGVRMAMERGRGRTAVPVRPALFGAVFGVLGVVAALVVGASLDRLATEPARFGWTFDAAVVGGGGETGSGGPCGPRRSAIERAPDIAAVANLCTTNLVVDGRPLAAVGVRAIRGTIPLSIMRGREPRTDREIALGELTLDRIGAEIGDRVSVTGSNGKSTARVVGTALFPSVQFPAVLADGAVMVPDELTRIAADNDNATNYLLVRWRPGANTPEARHRLERISGQPPNRPIRPAEVDRLTQLNRLPWILAGFLALLALIAVGHAIVTNTRRRRRDFALLETLGFRSRQLRATVAMQATTLAVIGLVLGIPLGVVAGRLAWGEIAGQIGVATDAALPGLAIAVLAPLTILAVLLIGYLPARAVSRIRPATALRSE